MTFFHFINCAALTYAPYYIVYKTTRLAEYDARGACIRAAIAYLVTQVAKMLLLATLFSSSPTMNTDWEQADASVHDSLLHAAIDSIDLIGMYYCIGATRTSGPGDLKPLIVGLGWAAGEAAVTLLLPLWVGARGDEFDWKFIRMGLDANLRLVHHIGVAMLLWLLTRNDMSKAPLGGLLALSQFRHMLVGLASAVVGVGAWGFLLGRAASTLFLSAICFGLLRSHVSQKQP
eukprot:Opistho-1_new@17356